MKIVKCDYCNKQQPAQTVPSNVLEHSTTVILSGKAAKLTIIVEAPVDEHICNKCAKSVARSIK